MPSSGWTPKVARTNSRGTDHMDFPMRAVMPAVVRRSGPECVRCQTDVARKEPRTRSPDCAVIRRISMNQRIWDKFPTERDKAVFAAGGFGARAGFGKRPAVLVIDVNWAFCGERPEPILQSIK